MADQWFIVRSGVRMGPYDTPGLKALAAAGQLQPADLVQGAAAQQAISAGSIPGLFAAGGTPFHPQQGKPLPQGQPIPQGQPAPQGTAPPQPAPGGEPRWFVLRNNQEHGPLSSAELIALAQQGTLGPADLVRREDLPTWVRASEIQGLFSAAPQSGAVPGAPSSAAAGAASDGFREALRTFKRTDGADRDQTIGEAFGGCIYNIQEAASALLSAPILLTFYTIVFLVASGLALAGIVTAVLYPVFVMGYVSVLHAYLTNRRGSLQQFIGFLRHGWNSLWHLFMLLAAFMTTLGMLVAPVVIVAGLTFTVGGGSLYAALKLSASSSSGASTKTAAPPRGLPPFPPPYDPRPASERALDALGLPAWVVEGGGKLLRTIVLVLSVTVMCLFSTPFFAALILFYYLVYDVSKGMPAKPGEDKEKASAKDAPPPFDLVFDAFGRMLLVGRRCWKELFLDGLLNAALLIGAPLLLTYLAGSIGEDFMEWYILFASPLLTFTLGVYINVFMVVACMGLSRWAPKPA